MLTRFSAPSKAATPRTTVRYEAAADEELIDEIVRYELRREGLGTEFLTGVQEAVRLVTQNPGAWQASGTDAMSASS